LYPYKKFYNEAYAYIMELFCSVDELYLVRGDSCLVRTAVSVHHVLSCLYVSYSWPTFPPIQLG